MKKYLEEDIIHFRTPPNMTEEIRRIAEENMVSKSAICRQALKHYIQFTHGNNEASIIR